MFRLKCLHFLLLHLGSNLLSESRWRRRSKGRTLITMLDQNFVVLHNVLFPSKWYMAKLVLGIDLATSIDAFNLGSYHVKRLAICGMSSLHSILGHMSIGSSLP